MTPELERLKKVHLTPKQRKEREKYWLRKYDWLYAKKWYAEHNQQTTSKV